MNRIVLIFISIFLVACEVTIGDPDAIEFSGDSFSYDEKVEIAKEAISNLGIDNLTAHILKSVPEVTPSSISLVDIRAIDREQSGESNLILSCHIEGTFTHTAKKKLIEACKTKLVESLKKVEHARKNDQWGQSH